jgi:hypothetical protein
MVPSPQPCGMAMVALDMADDLFPLSSLWHNGDKDSFGGSRFRMLPYHSMFVNGREALLEDNDYYSR